MKTKGQAFVSDFTVSIAVFGVILAAFFIPWNNMIESQTRFSEAEEMKVQAQRTAALLVTTPGYPQDWQENVSKAKILGFSEAQDNVISMEKLEAFDKLNYSDKRSLLETQNFYLSFVKAGTSELLDDVDAANASENIYSQGKKVSSDAETAVRVDRQVVVNKSGGFENAQMSYVMWR